MEAIVAKLLNDFERGGMSRRDLIQKIAVAAAVSVPVGSAAQAAAPAANAAASAPFKVIGVNHLSFGVADYARTRDFYSGLLGLPVSADTGKQCTLTFGKTRLIVKTRASGTPAYDHIAYSIANWDKEKVRAELTRRGLNPKEDTEYSFHVKDPDGYDLQIEADVML